MRNEPNRRAFLQTLVGGIVAGAAVRTWPFRVFSFPAAPVLTATELRITSTYFHIMCWGKVSGSEKFFPLSQTPIVAGKPMEFSIPSGATITGISIEPYRGAEHDFRPDELV